MEDKYISLNEADTSNNQILQKLIQHLIHKNYNEIVVNLQCTHHYK